MNRRKWLKIVGGAGVGIAVGVPIVKKKQFSEMQENYSLSLEEELSEKIQSSIDHEILMRATKSII